MPISRNKHNEDENQFSKNIGFNIQFFHKKQGMSQLN